jgi:hypothetical protein
MGQRSISLILPIEGLSAQAMCNKSVTVLYHDAMTYSALTKSVRQRQFPSVPRDPSDEVPNTVIDGAILDAIKKQPVSSICELAKLTCIPTITVHRHLTASLGLVLRHLLWVPRGLAHTQKPQCPTLSNKLMRRLRSINDQGWQFIVTLDEPWLYLTADYKRIWLRPDQELPERPKHTIHCKKNMVTFASNPLGFHVLKALRKGRTFDAEYYRDNILTALISLRPEAAGGNLLFMQIMQRPIRFKSVSPFVPKTAWHAPHTGRARLISHPETSFRSVMSNAVCREWSVH